MLFFVRKPFCCCYSELGFLQSERFPELELPKSKGVNIWRCLLRTAKRTPWSAEQPGLHEILSSLKRNREAACATEGMMVPVLSVWSAFAVYCKSTHFFVSLCSAYEAAQILSTLVLLFLGAKSPVCSFLALISSDPVHTICAHVAEPKHVSSST